MKKKPIQRKKNQPAHQPAPHKHQPHGQQRAVTIVKTFQSGGHWIEKPNRTPVVICPCGNKYLKTRAGQAKCLRCLSRATIGHE